MYSCSSSSPPARATRVSPSTGSSKGSGAAPARRRGQGQGDAPELDQLVNGAVRVVQEADEADAAGALSEAGGGDALLHAGGAEDALLGDLAAVVEVDALLGAGLPR